MPWINIKKPIPTTDPIFQDIVCGLVFNCPSSTEHKVKVGVNEQGKARYKSTYKSVSAREVSFRRRGISKSLFVTILAQIRRPLNAKKTYALIQPSESVEFTVDSIMSTTSMGDPFFELIVFQKRNDMSDTEAFYYYLRNAFAHGLFEVVPTNGGKVYLLESSKNGAIKAQMRLKENSLMEYIRLASLSVAEIKALQRHKK